MLARYILDLYWIELSDGKGVHVDQTNVDEVERTIREHFRDVYPEIAPK